MLFSSLFLHPFFTSSYADMLSARHILQPRSQGFFPVLGAGREKALASAGHVPILHPEILGVIN